MSAVSFAPSAPMRRRFPAAHGIGLARRLGPGLVARALTYPDQFTRRYRRSRSAPTR